MAPFCWTNTETQMKIAGIIDAPGAIVKVFEDGSASIENETYVHRRFSSAKEALDFLNNPEEKDAPPSRIPLNPQWGFQ